MWPKDFITGRREDHALTTKNAALLLLRDQSLCVKCLDWDRPVTEVWSLKNYTASLAVLLLSEAKHTSCTEYSLRS